MKWVPQENIVQLEVMWKEVGEREWKEVELLSTIPTRNNKSD